MTDARRKPRTGVNTTSAALTRGAPPRSETTALLRAGGADGAPPCVAPDGHRQRPTEGKLMQKRSVTLIVLGAVAAPAAGIAMGTPPSGLTSELLARGAAGTFR